MKTILCYGDSNTFGYNPDNMLRYPKEVRWTGLLSQQMGDKFEIIEEGCNGRTTIFDDPVDGWKNGLDYLMPCLNSHKPVDLVIMMIGSNDLKNVFHASIDMIETGVCRLIDEIITFGRTKQNFVPSILLVAPPLVGEPIQNSPFAHEFDQTAVERSKQFAETYRQIAEKKGCYFFDAAPVAEVSDKDHLHLTAQGHSNIAEGLYNELKKIYRLK